MIHLFESLIVTIGAPTIVNFKEHVFAVIGQPVYLDCNAKGYPLSTFKWFKDGWENLATDQEYKIFENGTLLIASVSKVNKGRLKCQALNRFGQQEKTVMLNVLGMLFVQQMQMLI